MTREGFFHVRIESKDLERALERLPRLVQNNLIEAGLKISKIVLETEGLKTYPPETKANWPPHPYYIRGKGTQYASGYNDGKSEDYKTKWNVSVRPNYVRLGNSASYAQYLAGRKQPIHMRRIGWRKLTGVILQKWNLIKSIYSKKIIRAIMQAGFKRPR